jgi:hypothetical protein
VQDPRPVVNALVQQVASDLRLTATLRHPGESGRAREQIITTFLARLVPEAFGVSSGFVIDAHGAVSRQVDIVVYRRGYHPVFKIGEIPLFLIEAVAAAIEVKAQIRTASILQGALANLESVRRLDRTNGGQNYVLNGARQDGPLVDSYGQRVFTAVITERSLAQANLVARLLRYVRENPRQLWPNGYVDIHKFLIAYANRAQEGGHIETDCDFDQANYLTVTDSTDTRFVSPLFELSVSLLDFLRLAPVIDYKPSSYLAVRGGRVTWSRIGTEVAAPTTTTTGI